MLRAHQVSAFVIVCAVLWSRLSLCMRCISDLQRWHLDGDVALNNANYGAFILLLFTHDHLTFYSLRRLPCTPSDVFNFCWTMFVQVKGMSILVIQYYHWFFENGQKVLHVIFQNLKYEIGDCLVAPFCDSKLKIV